MLVDPCKLRLAISRSPQVNSGLGNPLPQGGAIFSLLRVALLFDTKANKGCGLLVMCRPKTVFFVDRENEMLKPSNTQVT